MTDQTPAYRQVSIKVEPPYFDALMSGEKTFEVRKNDRAYQRGDVLQLIEWHPARAGYDDCWKCRNHAWEAHPTKREVGAKVTFVYSGDPRFGGIEPGYVVLALAVGVWRDEEDEQPPWTPCSVCGGHRDHSQHVGISVNGHRYAPVASAQTPESAS